MFGLVALADHATLDEVLDELGGAGVVEGGAEAIQGLLGALVPHLVCGGQDGRPQGGRGWDVDATGMDGEAVHNGPPDSGLPLLDHPHEALGLF